MKRLREGGVKRLRGWCEKTKGGGVKRLRGRYEKD